MRSSVHCPSQSHRYRQRGRLHYRRRTSTKWSAAGRAKSTLVSAGSKDLHTAQILGIGFEIEPFWISDPELPPMARFVHSPMGDALKTECVYSAEFQAQIEGSRLERHPLARFQIQPLQGLNTSRSGVPMEPCKGGGETPPPLLASRRARDAEQVTKSCFAFQLPPRRFYGKVVKPGDSNE